MSNVIDINLKVDPQPHFDITLSYVTSPSVILRLTEPNSPVLKVDFSQIGQRGADGEPIKAITIENVSGTEKLIWFYLYRSQTIRKVRAIVDNPSVIFNVHFGPDFSAPGTDVTTTPVAVSDNTIGQDVIIDNAIIPANSWVWITTSSVSGNIRYLNVTIEFL